jgi:hypothetical protein
VSVLHEDAVILFPGGLRIEGRERSLESLGTQPWKSYELDDMRVIQLTDKAAMVIYKTTAYREGNPQYVALISSTYIHDGEWKLVIHQHTPA